MDLIYSNKAASVTLAAATEKDLLPGASAGVRGQMTDADLDVLAVVLSNTGAADVETVTVYLAALVAGTFAPALTFALTAGAKRSLVLSGLAGDVRITGTSSAGTTVVVDVAASRAAGALPFQAVLDGVDQKGLSLGTALSVTTLTTSGAVTAGGAVGVTGDVTASGDLAAAGGFRQSVGPFYLTLAADQTAIGLKFGDTANMAWVAPRAGSITAVSAMLDTAVTGSTKTATVKVYKALAAAPTSFSAVNAALDLAFTSGGAELALKATAAKDTYTFAAGDLLKVVYTSNTITSTPKCAASVEIEC